MNRLLKYEMMFYREIGLVLIGVLLLVTLLGWLTNVVFNVSGGIILIVCSIFYFLVLLIVIAIIYFPFFSKAPEIWNEYLTLLVPVPIFWLLLSRLFTSLPIFAVTAACHTLLSLAFHDQTGINPYSGWQWLMLMGLYIMIQQFFIINETACAALKDRLVLPKKLGFLRKMLWGSDDGTSFFSLAYLLLLFICIPIVQYILQITFSENLPLSRLALAFLVYAFGAILLCFNSFLLEKHSNF